MTSSNHAATGAIIALAINQPVLALPAAYASHFLLDALPHFGFPGKGGYPEAFKHKYLTFTTEFLGLIGIVVVIIMLRSQTLWVWLAAILAISPDFMWPYVYMAFERKNKVHKHGPISQFHHNIQWCERPWGLFVEIAWFIGTFVILQKLI